MLALRYAVTIQPDRDVAVLMNHNYSPCMAMVSPSDSLVGAIVEPSRRGSKHWRAGLLLEVTTLRAMLGEFEDL